MTLLPLTILANAFFSAATGATAMLRPEAVAEALGLATSHVVPWIGGGLIAYSLLLAELLRRGAPSLPVAMCSLADFAWVVATIVLGLTVPTLLSSQGWLWMTAVAALVAIFGALQAKGLRARYRSTTRGAEWSRIVVRVPSLGDPEALWLQVADLAAIADHAPALASATVAYHGSCSAERTCTDRRGKRWLEHIQLDPSRRTMTATFQAEARDLPFPFRELASSWSVTPASGGSLLEATWEARPTSPWLSFVTMPLFEQLARATLAKTVASMSRSVAAIPSATHVAMNAGVR